MFQRGICEVAPTVRIFYFIRSVIRRVFHTSVENFSYFLFVCRRRRRMKECIVWKNSILSSRPCGNCGKPRNPYRTSLFSFYFVFFAVENVKYSCLLFVENFYSPFWLKKFSSSFIGVLHALSTPSRLTTISIVVTYFLSVLT